MPAVLFEKLGMGKPSEAPEEMRPRCRKIDISDQSIIKFRNVLLLRCDAGISARTMTRRTSYDEQFEEASVQPPTARRRPRERVLHYLDAEFDRPELKSGSRLPTVRQLASHLNVSSATVASVFRELARQRRIRTAIGNGTFLIANPKQSQAATFRIALNLPVVDLSPSAAWGGRMMQEIMQAAARNPRSVMIMPLEHGTLAPETLAQELIEERSEVDALILLPAATPRSEKARAAYELDGKPVVFINPPAANATSNFVSADFFGACRKLGQTWKETGRQRVVFLSIPLKDSVSAQLECFGLMMGFDASDRRGTVFDTIPARSVVEAEGYRALAEYLDQRGARPDAVFCSGDHLAFGALRALREHGFDVPGQVSVVGATGSDLAGTSCPQLTRLAQPFRALSEAAVGMVCERIEQKGVALPGRILATPFIGGATTRLQENEHLNIRS
ncbi:MAG: LacI family DNA-binding transcriptional regulator [Verrucomicrobiae bacterium]|nr:LacI family DNA-binding transcriptional regulator [Verrucomicrobiae bacterium]